MLYIIVFLPCLTREECSFLLLLLFVSDSDFSLNNSPSRTSYYDLRVLRCLMKFPSFFPLRLLARLFRVLAMEVVGSD